MSDYPEHDKLNRVAELAEPIGAFLAWLQVNKFDICDNEERRGGTMVYHPMTRTVEQWLADYLKIDLGKLQEETAVMIKKASVRL